MVVGLQVWWCRVRSKAERACHGPNTNVVTPSETAVHEKTPSASPSDQSPAACATTPSCLVSGPFQIDHA